jgi:hypothetical protein
MEVGLVDEATMRRERCAAPTLIPDPSPKRLRPARTVRFRSQHDILGEEKVEDTENSDIESSSDEEDDGTLATMKIRSPRPVFGDAKLFRMGLFALALVLMLPVLQMSPSPLLGARAGVIPAERIDAVEKREDTNKVVCKRWAHQCMCSASG